MRPTPIPDDEIRPGSVRVIYGAPSGMADVVDPVEVLQHHHEETNMPVISVRCELEPGDLGKLRKGAPVWVSFYGGGLMPFRVDVGVT